jgi:hypothetical protein
MKAARRGLIVAAIFCGAIGLHDVLYVWRLLSGGPLIGPGVSAFFPDFLVFQAAARAWAEGQASLIYDIDALTAFQNALFADRLPGEVRFRPFFYPPIWLLLLLMPAAVALFRCGATTGFLPGERLVTIALWLMPLAGMVLNRLGLPIVPLVILLFGAIAWSRLQTTPKGELRPAAAAR